MNEESSMNWYAIIPRVCCYVKKERYKNFMGDSVSCKTERYIKHIIYLLFCERKKKRTTEKFDRSEWGCLPTGDEWESHGKDEEWRHSRKDDKTVKPLCVY